MHVLGIETSCDETALAVYADDGGLLAHRLHSQTDLHAEFGGVVPELAARDHLARLPRLLDAVLADIAPRRITHVAYTAGPGLVGALLVGATWARALARAWELPALGVHHMEGHLLAPLLESPAPDFPFVALLVSGGHTQLIDVEGLGRYRLLGQTLDDAVGEAFDKTAKLLGLGYPGGPALEALAAEGDPQRYAFPRPMLRRPGMAFSFSGLKTAVVHAVQDAEDPAGARADIAASFQAAVCETLVGKCRRALEHTGRERLVVAGGVSANRALRGALDALGEKAGVQVFYPRPEFCTDNGAMIAYAGWCRARAGATRPAAVRARWPLDELTPPLAANP